MNLLVALESILNRADKWSPNPPLAPVKPLNWKDQLKQLDQSDQLMETVLHENLLEAVCPPPVSDAARGKSLTLTGRAGERKATSMIIIPTIQDTGAYKVKREINCIPRGFPVAEK